MSNPDQHYPDGFDASCGMTPEVMQAANQLASSLTGKRDWDVPAIAAALTVAGAPTEAAAMAATVPAVATPAKTPDKAKFWAWWEPYQLPDGWIARLDLIAWHAWQAAKAQREDNPPSNDEIDSMARAYLGDCGPQATRIYSFVHAILSRFSHAAPQASVAGQPAEPSPAESVWLFKHEGKWHHFVDEGHRQRTIEDGRWDVREFVAAPKGDSNG